MTLALARSLAEAGIATLTDWRRAGQQPGSLLRAVLARWVEERGAAEIAQHFELEARLVGSLDDLYGYAWRSTGKDLARRRVYLVVEAERTAYAALGPALRRLEAVHPALPATFFRGFADSVGRWVRVFDYRDAEDRLEREKEFMEEAMDEEEREGVELPDLSVCIPPALRTAPLGDRALGRVLRTAADPAARELMHAVRRLRRSAEREERPQYWCEELNDYDLSYPLPALLLVTDEHDAIEGLYDQEAEELYNWGVPQPPNALFTMDPADPDSVASAFRSLGVLCDTLAAASRVIALLETLSATEKRT
ncbi:MAG TPA: hypothetical protein VFQ76_02365 [Longimicrobiaceae bacterium]|nr:hypothetical protein [Longimicrobiaceae bacterium]